MKNTQETSRWAIVFHNSVWIYIAIGVVVILTTFLTDNNALEIAISALASVFIGIGVNNFSSLETRYKDQEMQKNIASHILKIFSAIYMRISITEQSLNEEQEGIRRELRDIGHLLQICAELIQSR